jgi:hypothetical protein
VVALFRKRRELEMPVETECRIVNCVHDECGRSDLRGLQIGPVQGVHKQELAEPPALAPPIYSKSPEQRRGYQWIMRQLARRAFRESAEIDDVGGQCIIAKDARVALP